MGNNKPNWSLLQHFLSLSFKLKQPNVLFSLVCNKLKKTVIKEWRVEMKILTGTRIIKELEV